MKKGRLIAFTDAILAIVMTILVLRLELPEEATWRALWASRVQFLSYAVSFMWLGAMWVNLHAQWHDAVHVDNLVVWLNIIMLFFASLFPYVTSFVTWHFMSRMAQVLYWILVLIVSLLNAALGRALGRANRDNEAFCASVKSNTKIMGIDIAIKVVALILALVLYPPIAMYGVLISGVFYCVAFQRKR